MKISNILEILNSLFLSDLPGINFIIIAKRKEIKDVRSLDEEEAWKVKTKTLFVTCRLFSCWSDPLFVYVTLSPHSGARVLVYLHVILYVTLFTKSILFFKVFCQSYMPFSCIFTSLIPLTSTLIFLPENWYICV